MRFLIQSIVILGVHPKRVRGTPLVDSENSTNTLQYPKSGATAR